jgi:hypothetical protein
MIVAADVVRRVVAEIAQVVEQTVRQLAQSTLVNVLEDLEVFVGPLVHSGKMHLLHGSLPTRLTDVRGSSSLL